MRQGGGKSKGASFERDVCKELSIWASNGKQEDLFWRSAMSGGRSTVAAKLGKRLAAQAGDITAIHPLGQPLIKHFLIECKHYKSLDFDGLITGKGQLVSFWQVALKQAATYGKQPMLIAKQNRFPTVICMTREGYSDIFLNVVPTLLSAPRHQLRIFLFDDFLKFAKPLKV